MKRLTTTPTVSMLALSTLLYVPTALADDSGQTSRSTDRIRMNVLLDLSGSMVHEACTLSGDSLTRLDVAKRVAAGWVEDKLTENGESIDSALSKVAVWTFSGDGTGNYFERIVPYTDPASALAAIDTISEAQLRGSTPLAGSICRVLDEMTADSVRSSLMSGASSARNLPQHHFFVATDGEENATPKLEKCAGDTSEMTPEDTLPGDQLPDFEPWSWQYKVAQKFLRFGDSAGPLIQDDSIPTPVVDALYLLPKVFYGHDCSDARSRSATIASSAPAYSYPTATFLAELSQLSKGSVQLALPDALTGAIDLQSLVQWDGPVVGEVIGTDGILTQDYVKELIKSPFAVSSGLSKELIQIGEAGGWIDFGQGGLGLGGLGQGGPGQGGLGLGGLGQGGLGLGGHGQGGLGLDGVVQPVHGHGQLGVVQPVDGHGQLGVVQAVGGHGQQGGLGQLGVVEPVDGHGHLSGIDFGGQIDFGGLIGPETGSIVQGYPADVFLDWGAVSFDPSPLTGHE